MLSADATCVRKSGAAFLLAKCPVATAVFPALRGGGAARYGARLLLPSAAVFAAAFEPRCPIRRASFEVARSTGTMLVADTTCCSTSGAAFLLAQFPANFCITVTTLALAGTNVKTPLL